MSVLTGRCPWCGLIILRYDDQKKLAHEVPECERFKELVAKFPRHTMTIEVIDPQTGQPTGLP